MLAVAHAGVWWVGPKAMKKAKAMKKQKKAMKKAMKTPKKAMKVQKKVMKKQKAMTTWKRKWGPDTDLLFPPFSCFVRELRNNYWTVFYPLMHPNRVQ